MDFIDQLRALGEKVSRLKDSIQTEEATKNAFIMPFIHALGYDVFNPHEVVPEYVADLGIKKGEKVDYCILKDNQPIMIMECKWWGHDLDVHNSQLHRYFHVTHARFGILTNGVVYRFYADLDEANKMDDKPFFEFIISDLKDNQISEIKKFHKSYFDVAGILNSASELKYAKEIRNLMTEQLVSPSDEFVKFFAGRVYSGRVTSKILEQFSSITKRALNNLISDMISDRLKLALSNEAARTAMEDQKPLEVAAEEVKSQAANKIITTELELEAFLLLNQYCVQRCVPHV